MKVIIIDRKREVTFTNYNLSNVLIQTLEYIHISIYITVREIQSKYLI